jgi:RNA polymerase sigma-70 factor (ECF subfamily)
MMSHRCLLVQIARERDTTAFDALADAYRNGLRRYLLVQTDGDVASAEDLLQEVLLRLWTRADTWDGRGSVKAWLFRIAANLALNHRRNVARRRERPLTASDWADDEGDASDVPAYLMDRSSLGPDALAVRADETARARRLLADLPEETRELLRLVHEEERDLRDVATVFHIPEGTVKSRLFHARKRLARAWRDQEDEEGEF